MSTSALISKMVTIARQLIVGTLLLVAWTCSASADGLFAPLSSDLAGVAAAQDTPATAVVRSRDVAIDPAYLAARIAPEGMDAVEGRLDMAPSASTVRIELFPGFVVDLDRKSLTEAFGGGFVWTGQSKNGPEEAADLVIRNGRITGVVTYASRNYRIDPLGVGTAHRISELDGSAYPTDIVLPVESPKGSSPPKSKDDRSGITANATIDILVAYTTRARDSVADVVAQANLAVSRANTGFSTSNIDINFRLVGTILVSGYDELQAGRTFQNVLDDLTNGTASGPFQPVHARRNSAGADLIGLLINKTDFCGIGWMPNPPSAATANIGIAVTAISCITNESFVHEAGHNMGLDHDRFVLQTPPPNSEYKYGYVNLPGLRRDIMAYNNQCVDADPTKPCQRLNLFSSPLVFSNGFVMGVAQNNPGAADASRWLREIKGVIAAYRPTAGPPPAPTTTIVSAITPVARVGQVGNAVTAFATIINAGASTATTCRITKPAGGQPFTLDFYFRNLPGNTLGAKNAAVNIAPGASANFLLSFTPTGAMQANLLPDFDCSNTPVASKTLGLNSFLLVGTATPSPDVLSTAVAAGGTLSVPLNGTAAVAMASVNIGASATLTARLSTVPIGGATAALPLTMRLCRTNPTTGACITAQTASPISFTATPNQAITFSGFVTGVGQAIAFDPANKRLFIHFFQGTTPVGSASVAVRTVANPDASIAAAN